MDEEDEENISPDVDDEDDDYDREDNNCLLL